MFDKFFAEFWYDLTTYNYANWNLRRGQIAAVVAAFCLFVCIAAWLMGDAKGAFVFLLLTGLWGGASLLSFALHGGNLFLQRRKQKRRLRKH